MANISNALWSWAVFLAVAGAYFYWAKQSPSKNSRRKNQPTLKVTDTGVLSASGLDSDWAVEKPAGKKGKTRSKPKRAPAAADTTASEQEGSRLLSAGTEDKNSSLGSSPAVSTHSGDGDDELERVPPLDPHADMLEAPAPGAAVLRITPSNNPFPQKVFSKPAPKEQLTKKQRQNRDKREAQKAAVAANHQDMLARRENHFKELKQEQRKEQGSVGSMAPPPTSNPWVNSKSAPAAAPKIQEPTPIKPIATNQGELLDTMALSEEDQIREAVSRSLGGSNDGWTTVDHKKKLKKKPGEDGPDSRSSFSVTTSDAGEA